jgi:hypothetical protein
MTTRRHHPGVHGLELVINGETHELGTFDVRA